MDTGNGQKLEQLDRESENEQLITGSSRTTLSPEQTERAHDEATANESSHDETAANESKHGEAVDDESKKSANKKGSRRAVRIVLIILACIVILCAILVSAFALFANSGKEELLAPNEESFNRKVIFRNGVKYAYNENMVTVAVIGTDRLYGYVLSDESQGSADAIIMVAYDTSTGKITLINVPRNIYTRFNYDLDDPEATLETFISVAYSYGNSDSEGAELVCGALSSLFGGIPVEEYVVLLESCIDPLTEAMGGVTVTAIQDVPWVKVEKGKTYTMKGEQALRYVQWRDISEANSAADRAQRQHTFAQAFLRQSIDAIKKDPGVLGKFYDIITDPDYMTTNLELNELAYLVSSAILNGVNDLEMVTVPFDVDFEPGISLVAYLPKEGELIDLLVDVYYKPVG